LDAVAFLWKELGTNCLHLPETHELVKLMRDLLAVLAPHTLVLTETNVPHKENVSYFGGDGSSDMPGDEAHMVYNFSLPPLLLEAFLSSDATAINAWLEKLAPPPPDCTFFNFTASHDGIGVRPIEGLVSNERLAALVEAVIRRGARVNTRRQPDGSDTPYELCITYFSALAPERPDDELHVRRFLASQAVMLALRGMPAVYFHSLVGTPNDIAGAEACGIHRRINRRKYERAELDAAIADGTVQRQVFDGMRMLLKKRRVEPALHPDAAQQVVPSGSSEVLAFERTSIDGKQSLLVAVNFSEKQQTFSRPESYRETIVDLISGEKQPARETLLLTPGQAAWFTVNS
jgi:glycosidase